MLFVVLKRDVNVLGRISYVVYQNAHSFLIMTIVVIVYRYLLSNYAQIEKRENIFCKNVVPADFSNSQEKIKLEVHLKLKN